MPPEKIDPAATLRECGTDDPMDLVRLGVAAAREENFERGLIFLADAYRRFSARGESAVPASALSYYGLCLALNKGRVKEAAEFCQLAIQREFYTPEHYLNLAKVWAAGRSRKKAIDALDRGLVASPGNQSLLRYRAALGVRRSPVLPFLGRDNPLNVTLGRVRHTMRERKTGKGRKS